MRTANTSKASDRKQKDRNYLTEGENSVVVTDGVITISFVSEPDPVAVRLGTPTNRIESPERRTTKIDKPEMARNDVRSEAKPKSEIKLKSGTRPKSGTKLKSETEPKPETKSEPETEPKPEAKPNSETKLKSESEPKPETKLKSEAKTEARQKPAERRSLRSGAKSNMDTSTGPGSRAESVAAIQLFNEPWYRSQVGVFEGSGYEHYLSEGIAAGASPSPLFDVEYYAGGCPGVNFRKVNPLQHYLETPVAERVDPHPLFDQKFYRGSGPELPAGADPFLYFLADKASAKRRPHALFDPAFYLENNPGLEESGVPPLLHYIVQGAGQGRDPHPLFSTYWYLSQTEDPEAAAAPLQHYLFKGGAEGISPHPLFDPVWYCSQTDDAVAKLVPLKHYIEIGSAKGLSPHRLFDPAWYRRTQIEPSAEVEEALSHYVRRGEREGLDPNPLFSSAWYRNQNSDVAKAGINSLIHYVMYGAAEMRDPHPVFSTADYLRHHPDCRASGKLALVHALENDRPAGGSFSGLTAPKIDRHAKQATKSVVPAAAAPKASVLASHRYLAEIIGWEAGETAAQRIIPYFKIIENLDVGGSTQSRAEKLDMLVERMRTLSAGLVSNSEPEVTIIVPAFNKVEYTIACIISLFEHRSHYRYEVLIGNNISSDETRPVFEAVGGVLRCITHDVNEGFIRNCNLSALQAKGQYVVLLNNDTLIIDGWLDALIAPFKSLDRIGLVGSKLLMSDGRLQEAGGIVWNDAGAWNFGRNKDPRASEFNYLKDIDYISGASIAIPTAIWREIGGFDERYVPAYFDDSDLAFGLRSLGYRTIYQPTSVLVHHEGITHGTEVSTGMKAYQVTNKAKFIDKWREALETDQFPDAQSVFLARDRSRYKPHILFVDHYVPQFDKDAGSRTIYEYIMLFVKSGFHVTFWPENLFYDRPYVRALQALGCEVLYGSEYVGGFDAWMKENGQFLDYALLSRAHIADQFIDTVREYEHIRVLYYGHDITFLRLQMQMEVEPSPQAAQELEKFEVLERAMWDKSDIIYYPADFECEFVARERPDRVVRLFPPYLYDEAAIADARRRVSIQKCDEPKSAIFVAGFRHAPNADAAIWLGRAIWPRVLERVPNAILYIAGSFPPPEVEALGDHSIKVTGFISDDILETLYRMSHVCVAPLRYGGGVKRKVIEGMQFGLPVVTTTVGAQGLTDPQEFMSIADDAEAFADKIIEILLDPEFGRTLASNAISCLSEHFSVEYARRLLAKDIPEIADGQSGTSHPAASKNKVRLPDELTHKSRKKLVSEVASLPPPRKKKAAKPTRRS